MKVARRSVIMGGKSRVWLSFSIANFACDPEDITKGLGVKPTRVIKKGEILKPRIVQRANVWTLQIKTGNDLQIQAETLLKKLKFFPKIRNKIKGTNIRLTAVFEVVNSESNATLSLDAETLERIGKMGIDFGIDYYFFKN